MTGKESAEKTFVKKALIIIRRFIGYGVTFTVLFAVLLNTPFDYDFKSATRGDRRSQVIDGLSLKTPDPVKYLTRGGSEPERFPVSSDRIDTMLVQGDIAFVSACVGLKDGKSVVAYYYSDEMHRVMVNDSSIYWPVVGGVRFRKKDPEIVNQVIGISMERLAKQVGAQGIKDLLTISRAYYRNTHASRDLQFVSDQLAMAWNKLHPEEPIKIPEMPGTYSEPRNH